MERKTKTSGDYKRISIFIPDNFILTLRKFDLAIKEDPSIPKDDAKMIHSENQLRSFAIRALINQYVEDNKE